MGLGPILDKLNVQFSQVIDCEAHAMYVIVELGKSLEHDDWLQRDTTLKRGQLKRQFPAIMLYRNWAAHTKLDLSDLADEIVRDFDEYIASNNATLRARLEELLKPEVLRQEIIRYLKPQGVSMALLDSRMRWKRFLKHLFEVTRETPLLIHRNKGGPTTRFVKSITVERSRNVNGRATLTWKAQCKMSPPAGVDTEIFVVLDTDFDKIGKVGTPLLPSRP